MVAPEQVSGLGRDVLFVLLVSLLGVHRRYDKLTKDLRLSTGGKLDAQYKRSAGHMLLLFDQEHQLVRKKQCFR